MTTFTNVPKHVEDVLEKWSANMPRRSFLKSAGLFVVSLGAAGAGDRDKTL